MQTRRTPRKTEQAEAHTPLIRFVPVLAIELIDLRSIGEQIAAEITRLGAGRRAYEHHREDSNRSRYGKVTSRAVCVSIDAGSLSFYPESRKRRHAFD